MRKINILLVLVLLIMFILPSAIFASNIKSSKPDIDGVIPVTAMVDSKMELKSPSAVLMEGSTGTILFEKNKDEKLKPASITKIMTLLLIFEALMQVK